jgi:penicillin-binding protein 2
MADVVNPIGTANSAHLKDVDFAGKTGSAQVISNAARKFLKGKQFNDNGWFAGVSPRRNPEIVVCALIEQGEHGYIAARAVSQVVKAYADKQRRAGRKFAEVPQKAEPPKKVEVAGVWSRTDEHGHPDGLQGGRFTVDLSRKSQSSRHGAGD